MSVISGNLSLVDGISAREWMVREGADHKRYVDSRTKGSGGRLAGNTDWSGRVSSFGYTPVKMPKELFTFKGSVDGSKGVAGPVIVDSVEINWDIENGEIIQHVTEFSGNGVFDDTDTSSLTDAAVPDPPTSIGTKLQLAVVAGSPSFSALADVRNMRLRITADNKNYVTSSTGGVNYRKAGNIDAEFSAAVFADTINSLPSPNDFRFARIFVDSTLYWELRAMIFGEMSDLVANRETGDLIGCTLNAAFSGFFDVSGTPTEGIIHKPGASSWWPA